MTHSLRATILRRLTVVVVLSMIGVIGCSTSASRYKVVSFFFDGVPNPDASKLVVRQKSTGRPIYVHQPYAEQKCDSCHTSTQDIFARAMVPTERCLSCHPNVVAKYAKMHGPVASMECMQCHSGHQSLEPHLLKVASPKLCLNCHLPATLSVATAAHTDLTVSCIDCHSGHGGEDTRMLKASYRAAPPALVPATMAADSVEVAE